MNPSRSLYPGRVFSGGRIRSNAILYCRHFGETVAFYREVLGLAVHHRTAWLVEFQLSEGAYLSIADTRRATIESASGAGFTLSLAVDNIDHAHTTLEQRGIILSKITTVWEARVFYLHDPEGHRIELWQNDPATDSSVSG